MRKNRILSPVLAAATFVLLLCSCNQTANQKKIIGTWQGNGGLEFTYVMTDDMLTFRLPEVGWGMPYEIDGDTMTLSHKILFTRQQ